MRKLWVLVVLLCMAQVASAGLITSVVRSNSSNDEPAIAADLDEDSLTFVDRPHQYNEVPASVLGADYIMVANDDKTDGDIQYEVTLAGPVDLYLFIDNRVGDDVTEDGPTLGGGVMDWVADAGFVSTGEVIGIDESADGVINQYGALYRLAGADGMITLYQQDDGGSRNMYGIAAVPEPATMMLLGLGGLALVRRRK